MDDDEVFLSKTPKALYGKHESNGYIYQKQNSITKFLWEIQRKYLFAIVLKTQSFVKGYFYIIRDWFSLKTKDNENIFIHT